MKEALLGGAIGSIITIIATFICWIIQKTIEHKHEFKKTILEKKLVVAEAASSYYTRTSTLFKSLSYLYNHVKKSGIQDVDLFTQFHNDIVKKLQSLFNDPLASSASSLDLYFNFGDKFPNEKKVFGDFYSSMSNLIDNITIYETYDEMEIETADPEAQRKIEKLQDDIIKKIIDDIESLSGILTTISDFILAKQSILRNEILAYEKSRFIEFLSKFRTRGKG